AGACKTTSSAKRAVCERVQFAAPRGRYSSGPRGCSAERQVVSFRSTFGVGGGDQNNFSIQIEVIAVFGVRRPVGALAAGDPSPAVSRQVATDQSGDRSPHSKTVFSLTSLRPFIIKGRSRSLLTLLTS